MGQRANQVKLALEAALAEQAERVRQAELAQKLAAETLDVTLPGRPQTLGRLHPITQTLREIYRVMGEMGFQVYRARDVETDDYNFTLLNIPPHHPARDMWDTYYMTTPVWSCAHILRRGRSAPCGSMPPIPSGDLAGYVLPV